MNKNMKQAPSNWNSYSLSIDCEMSKPIHWCPFSDSVSPLSPDPQPGKRIREKKTYHHKFENNDLGKAWAKATNIKIEVNNITNWNLNTWSAKEIMQKDWQWSPPKEDLFSLR